MARGIAFVSPASRVQVWGRLLGVVAAIIVGIVVLEHPATVLESHAYAGLLHVLGFRGVALVTGASIYIVPAHSSAFWAELTPACSSLGPLLVLAGLAAMLPRVAGARRLSVGYVVAAVAIVLGNLVRIDASILVGLLWGRVALVLFHNAVGSIFAFVYTLGGYVFLLRYQLPTLEAGSGRPGVG